MGEVSGCNYEMQSGELASLAWDPSQVGRFVSTSKTSGQLRIWNMSESKPIQLLKIHDSPFTGLTFFPNSASFIGTFKDGFTGVFDIKAKRWKWRSETGHSETIFDCHFHPNDPDQLASCSFDGTVKILDVNTNKVICDMEMEKSSALYSCSWNPDGKGLICAGTSNGNIVVADMKKGHRTQCLGIHGAGKKVFNVSWSPHDDNLIASCGEDRSCTAFRPFGAKPGTVVWKEAHPDTCYGCDWHPHRPGLIATVCGDGHARVFDTNQAARSLLQDMPVTNERRSTSNGLHLTPLSCSPLLMTRRPRSGTIREVLV